MADLRVSLNEKAVARLPLATDGQYKVRDTDLKGFYLLIGKRRRTYMIQGDLRQQGKRAASIKVSVGDAEQMSARDARTTAKTYLVEISRGRHPKAPEEAAPLPLGAEVTLRVAWARYLEGHMIRKGRSENTIRNYRTHVEKNFEEWLDLPVAELANDPARVADMHEKISKENGPYQANTSMRTLRAIYNYIRKKHRALPVYNPVDGVDWNKEERRNTGMGLADIVGWLEQLAAFENPIRREFHLLTLLSGCRPAALKEAKPEHIDFRRRVLHIATPKGGAKRAFDIPLSREMMGCLVRALRYSRVLYPRLSREWVFPAESSSGHMSEQREERSELSKWGNDLRQSYRTLATAAGLSEIDAKLLMNHAIPGVNSGYITRHKLLENHLRAQQQAISSVIFATVTPQISKSEVLSGWLGVGVARRVTAAPTPQSHV
ncbi:MAG: integrase arm-type DNA-binding domain-containing protein [Sphingobium sp.]|jgi:integrase|uniref:tyrosine-type recombinase/integrase n=1 Tax=Sphingomonas sp. 28-62-20 TaxID=1970433 RepID=UPI000BD513A7|nr:integrase arm-type DNA-binding domain-containing protein [Sphingobium sp.]OYY77732.1 MAG: integrase [Sphingomonas sp. 28-62-20]